MQSIKRYKQLYNDSAAGTGSWVRLDNRYESISVRPLHFSITAGDTFVLQAIVKDVRGDGDGLTYLSTLLPSEIATIGTFAVTADELLEGNYSWIRVIKSGTNGVGVVEGFI